MQRIHSDGAVRVDQMKKDDSKVNRTDFTLEKPIASGAYGKSSWRSTRARIGIGLRLRLTLQAWASSVGLGFKLSLRAWA